MWQIKFDFDLKVLGARDRQGVLPGTEGFIWIYFPLSFPLPSLSDGELYAGVYIDFMGTDSAIFRTGKQTAMRTDQYNSRWLNGK